MLYPIEYIFCENGHLVQTFSSHNWKIPNQYIMNCPYCNSTNLKSKIIKDDKFELNSIDDEIIYTEIKEPIYEYVDFPALNLNYYQQICKPLYKTIKVPIFNILELFKTKTNNSK